MPKPKIAKPGTLKDVRDTLIEITDSNLTLMEHAKFMGWAMLGILTSMLLFLQICHLRSKKIESEADVDEAMGMLTWAFTSVAPMCMYLQKRIKETEALKRCHHALTQNAKTKSVKISLEELRAIRDNDSIDKNHFTPQQATHIKDILSTLPRHRSKVVNIATYVLVVNSLIKIPMKIIAAQIMDQDGEFTKEFDQSHFKTPFIALALLSNRISTFYSSIATIPVGGHPAPILAILATIVAFSDLTGLINRFSQKALDQLLFIGIKRIVITLDSSNKLELSGSIIKSSKPSPVLDVLLNPIDPMNYTLPATWAFMFSIFYANLGTLNQEQIAFFTECLDGAGAALQTNIEKFLQTRMLTVISYDVFNASVTATLHFPASTTHDARSTAKQQLAEFIRDNKIDNAELRQKDTDTLLLKITGGNFLITLQEHIKKDDLPSQYIGLHEACPRQFKTKKSAKHNRNTEPAAKASSAPAAPIALVAAPATPKIKYDKASKKYIFTSLVYVVHINNAHIPKRDENAWVKQVCPYFDFRPLPRLYGNGPQIIGKNERDPKGNLLSDGEHEKCFKLKVGTTRTLFFLHKDEIGTTVATSYGAYTK